MRDGKHDDGSQYYALFWCDDVLAPEKDKMIQDIQDDHNLNHNYY